MNKDIKQVIKYSKELGFDIDNTKTGHLIFTGYGRRIISSSTPSDYRVITTLKNNLKKISQGKIVGKIC